MTILFRDYESRSTLDLRGCGADKYACHQTTDVWCMAYAVDDGPVQLWMSGDPVPTAFTEAANNPDWIVSAFNDSFERAIETHIMGPRYGFPIIPLERHRCSQAAAQALALPSSLKHVAAALGLDHQKDEAGQRLMLLMAKPRQPRKNKDLNGIYWFDDAERRARLHAYCKQDVETERTVHNRIGHLPEAEQAVWLLDARINDRGIPIDREMVAGAIRIGIDALTYINNQLCEVTSGAVETVSQVARLITWIKDSGVAVENVRKDTITSLLAQSDLPDKVRRALELRHTGAHISAAKFGTMLEYACDDDRIRGAFKYHQAGTGRWASKGPQFQNLKKSDSIDRAVIDQIRRGDFAEMQKLCANPLETVGGAARAAVAAPDGARFIRGDFSGIESRVLAWIAGEQWKVDQWAKFDRTGDPHDEPYFVLGKNAGFDDDKARKPGKTCDLAFGYGGGERSWRNFAGDEASSEEVERLKRAYRDAHPKMMKFWYGLAAAAVCAVENPGTVYSVNERVAFRYRTPFLRMRLPNGRCLAYPFPVLEQDRYGNKQVVFKDNKFGKVAENRAWFGLLTENVVQAIARDLLVEAMQRLEAAGYPIIMHVHDEIVAEVPYQAGSVKEFARIMSEAPPWADGLPVAVKAHNGPRFCEVKESEDEQPPDDDDPPAAPQPESPRQESKSNGGAWGDYHAGQDERGEDAIYVYTDPAGRPHQAAKRYYQKVKGQWKKGFAQYHREGDTWAEGAPSHKFPYRLPQLIAAPLDEWIHIPEGEKDCETLAALDLITTTNPGGAKVWPPELSSWFTGRKVYILEDNDDAGRKHTQMIVRALANIAAEIRIVSFPEVRERGDVTDWLNSGHTKDELIERCASAPLYKNEESLDRVLASAVEMKSVTWVWLNRFAIGKLGIIAGLPDEGKGQIFCYIAARITSKTDKRWPCGEGVAPDGSVIILTAEDDPSDTVVPRLAAAGADLSRIHIVQMVRDSKGGKRMFNLATDLKMLRGLIEQIGDVVMVMIDPVSAYMGDGKAVDTYRTSPVRSVLGPVVDLAVEFKVAMLGIMHFNKKVDVTNALLRISDSLAFGAAARHVYGVIADTENDRKLFVRAKNNLADKSKDKTLAYTFSSRMVGRDPPDTGKEIWAPHIVWQLEYVDVTATQAMQAVIDNKSPGQLDHAKQFLRELLGQGPVKAGECKEAAKENGIADRTIRRAREGLVDVRKEVGLEGDWYWKLKDGDHKWPWE